MTLALACLTRYEAWPITAAAVVLAAIALVRMGATPIYVATRVGAFAFLPAAAVMAVMVLSA